MKVEYSFFKDTPCMAVKGTDFLQAMENEEQKYLLGVAVDGFCARIGADTHFGREVNEVIASWVRKNGTVLYCIQERWIGDCCTDSWCEVYVQNGIELKEIVVSDDHGRHYSLREARADHE